jgi:hypothetical protein
MIGFKSFQQEYRHSASQVNVQFGMPDDLT